MDFISIVCIILLFFIIHNFVVSRYFHIELTPDEIHFTFTRDNWRLAISRYKPEKQLYKEPVILCHGLGVNRYNMDFGNDFSIAKFLRDRGFDVWVAELRGIGYSGHPRIFSRYRYGYSFDDFVNLDAPAIIDAVTAETGVSKVFWVGHSMGGMIAYCFLQSSLASKIAGVVAVASPHRFKTRKSIGLDNSFLRLCYPLRVLHLEQITTTIAPYIQAIPNVLLKNILNPANITPYMLKRASVNVNANISCGVFRQFADWSRTGHMMDSYMNIDYTDGMKNITTPIFFLSGGGDMIVPPRLVKELHDTISSKDKTFKCFSIAEGFKSDYGHGDILLGTTAPLEVYPAISEWIEARADKK